MSGKVKGTLVIIGGSEDRKHKCLILKRFVELAGGEKARLAVITAATAKPTSVGSFIAAFFRSWGCRMWQF
ncbi:type 1 glutamine amidotransferase family protein [Syntrophaceticus schinkii]|uniref:Cyanophycinase (Part 1) n=1 Tax=Syntrophaceticus schinkii TaxID=499207 RepID=A0A0B7MGG2_9FIRM|nr:Cyanophycinase (Part 1) [Syntrophaceticus schinkii]